MGQAKLKRQSAFPPELIAEWEATDCVNFAVGLARLTGWLLEVDWWTTATKSTDKVPLDQLKPIRVHVADNCETIFDSRGIRSLVEYNQSILYRRLPSGLGSIDTRFYQESKLPTLPLRSQPNEVLVARALAAIQANPLFLAAIPRRTQPNLPAYDAAHFSLGRCAPFSEALHTVTGLPPVAILAVRFAPHFSATETSDNGYVHSVVLHPDGMGEDAWGKAPLRDIARRFGVEEFTINGDAHRAVVAALQQNSSIAYEIAVRDALELLKTYRGTAL